MFIQLSSGSTKLIAGDFQMLRPTGYFMNFYKKAQAKKNREQRIFNEDLFSITKQISNQHVLLVDDVFTTGNTMSAVAWQILKEGNNKVSVLVMAMD